MPLPASSLDGPKFSHFAGDIPRHPLIFALFFGGVPISSGAVAIILARVQGARSGRIAWAPGSRTDAGALEPPGIPASVGTAIPLLAEARPCFRKSFLRADGTPHADCLAAGSPSCPRPASGGHAGQVSCSRSQRSIERGAVRRLSRKLFASAPYSRTGVAQWRLQARALARPRRRVANRWSIRRDPAGRTTMTLSPGAAAIAFDRVSGE